MSNVRRLFQYESFGNDIVRLALLQIIKMIRISGIFLLQVQQLEKRFFRHYIHQSRDVENIEFIKNILVVI